MVMQIKLIVVVVVVDTIIQVTISGYRVRNSIQVTMYDYPVRYISIGVRYNTILVTI